MAKVSLTFDDRIAHLVVDGSIHATDADVLHALQRDIFERFSEGGRWVSLVEVLNTTQVDQQAVALWKAYLAKFRLNHNAPYVTAIVIDSSVSGAEELEALVVSGYQDAMLPVRAFKTVAEARWWLGGAFG